MATDGLTPSQEDALRDVAQMFADEDHNAETVATQLRLYAIEWNIHYLETDIIQIAEEAVEARATAGSAGQPGTSGARTDRKPDRRQGERRKGERRKADRRKRDRRRTGFAALVANFFRFGKEERRKGDRRTGGERRQDNRRHMTRRLIVRRRKDR